MGYTTEFDGVLKFKTELTTSELRALNSYLGEDVREHKDWTEGIDDAEYMSYVDLKVTDDFTGIKWDGSEKTYGMVSLVNMICKEMKKIKPDFELIGELQAQGEEASDRWILRMVDGVATEVKLIPTGELIECPHCGEEFRTGEYKEGGED